MTTQNTGHQPWWSSNMICDCHMLSKNLCRKLHVNLTAEQHNVTKLSFIEQLNNSEQLTTNVAVTHSPSNHSPPNLQKITRMRRGWQLQLMQDMPLFVNIGLRLCWDLQELNWNESRWERGRRGRRRRPPTVETPFVRYPTNGIVLYYGSSLHTIVRRDQLCAYGSTDLYVCVCPRCF